jgi:hypothetical protein
MWVKVLKILYSLLIGRFNKYIVQKNISKERESMIGQIFGVATDENLSRKEENLNIFGESLFQQLPLEYINTDDNIPLGIEMNVSYVLRKEPFFKDKIDIIKGVTIFYAIPQYGKWYCLENTKIEKECISNVLQSKNKHVNLHLFGNENATIDNLKEVLRKGTEIIHFATHGIVEPLQSNITDCKLLMAKGKDGNRFLTCNDILHLDFSAVDMVVLSACNTSLDKIERGESMQGLANAFLNAGAKSVLATKNYIDDSLTVVFMSKFYEFLLEYPVIDVLRLTRKHFHTSNYADFHLKYIDGQDVTGIDKEVEVKTFLSNWAIWF